MYTMHTKEYILLLLLGAVVLVPLLARLLMRYLGFLRQTRYLKSEISRARTAEEKDYWRKELRALRWSFALGLPVEAIARLRERFNRRN